MEISVIEVIIAGVNVILAAYVIILTKRNMQPKLYVDANVRKLKDDEYISYKEIYPHQEINFQQKGFPEIGHEDMIWELMICNNSEIPATEVVLEYSVIIKKKEFDYGKDEADIINERIVEFKEFKRTYKVDYIAPGTKKKINVIMLGGEFPEADLKNARLSSKEGTKIDKVITLDSYIHPEFEALQDSHHRRQMIGAYK